MGSKISQCRTEAWSRACITSHFEPISVGCCRILEPSCNCGWNFRPENSRDQRTILQVTDVIKQGVVCLVGQRWNFAYRLPGQGCNHHGIVLRCTSRQTEAATGLQASIQAFERNLFSSRQCFSSQGVRFTPEIGNLYFKFWNTLPRSPDVAPSDYYLFSYLKKHLKGRTLSSIEKATLAADGWFAGQPK
jgi:hypothetical protein